MKNNEFNNLNDKELLRLTGIKQAIFNKMLDFGRIKKNGVLEKTARKLQQ